VFHPALKLKAKKSALTVTLIGTAGGAKRALVESVSK